MKRWQLVVLIFELALFAVILSLPQVELPDFTLHGGSAPGAMSLSVASSPQRAAIVVASPFLLPDLTVGPVREIIESSEHSPVSSRLALLCTRVC